MPKKEHFCLSENSKLFPETWWKIEYFDIEDGSRISSGEGRIL